MAKRVRHTRSIGSRMVNFSCSHSLLMCGVLGIRRHGCFRRLKPSTSVLLVNDNGQLAGLLLPFSLAQKLGPS
ncbi:hypothetical protein BD410DRAFT_520013 [Rickenella mellea]|uniref:Uncharacterized protein n=1 Tax=Rickenella mellea TaxID=50990 RepID=A0A4Y7QFG5_9AGAM|nr:hypothetical protein BD410DRAFT_520013 [Rickenella mellea]